MHIVPTCYATANGGAEKYLRDLSLGLTDLGHEITLIGSIPGWEATGLESKSVAFTPKWGGRKTVAYLRHLPRERRAVAEIAASVRADVFHAQFKREQIGLTKTLHEVAPVVWTEHGRFPTGSVAKGLRLGYRRAAQDVSAIVCVTDNVAAEVREIVGSAPVIEVVPNAVDTDRLRPATEGERAAARAELGISSDARVLCWVGQLTAAKRPELAVAAGRAFPGVTLIAGDGPMAERVRAAADGDRVRYLGYSDDPSQIMFASDALLFTSAGDGEGLPYTLLEAAACGLPLVLNEGAGLAELANAANAVIAADSGGALAGAAIAAAESGGAPSRRWAEEHNVQRWIKAHEQIFASAGPS